MNIEDKQQQTNNIESPAMFLVVVSVIYLRVGVNLSYSVHTFVPSFFEDGERWARGSLSPASSVAGAYEVPHDQKAPFNFSGKKGKLGGRNYDHELAVECG